MLDFLMPSPPPEPTPPPAYAPPHPQPHPLFLARPVPAAPTPEGVASSVSRLSASVEDSDVEEVPAPVVPLFTAPAVIPGQALVEPEAGPSTASQGVDEASSAPAERPPKRQRRHGVGEPAAEPRWANVGRVPRTTANSNRAGEQSVAGPSRATRASTASAAIPRSLGLD